MGRALNDSPQTERPNLGRFFILKSFFSNLIDTAVHMT